MCSLQAINGRLKEFCIPPCGILCNPHSAFPHKNISNLQQVPYIIAWTTQHGLADNFYIFSIKFHPAQSNFLLFSNKMMIEHHSSLEAADQSNKWVVAWYLLGTVCPVLLTRDGILWKTLQHSGCPTLCWLTIFTEVRTPFCNIILFQFPLDRIPSTLLPVVPFMGPVGTTFVATSVDIHTLTSLHGQRRVVRVV